MIKAYLYAHPIKEKDVPDYEFIRFFKEEAKKADLAVLELFTTRENKEKIEKIFKERKIKKIEGNLLIYLFSGEKIEIKGKIKNPLGEYKELLDLGEKVVLEPATFEDLEEKLFDFLNLLYSFYEKELKALKIIEVTSDDRCVLENFNLSTVHFLIPHFYNSFRFGAS